ncbi:MAG TPA: hypothetical protein VG144_01610 [Gaiellaceae bacterium]|nr:hypothetical protein [Gaiellaceae bacterium]
MSRRLAFLGGIAVAVAALWRTIRRRPAGWVDVEPVDPRAEELRQRLEEARPVVDERDEFEAAETTVDAVDAVPDDPEARRRAVHAEGRSVVERMRGSTGDE